MGKRGLGEVRDKRLQGDAAFAGVRLDVEEGRKAKDAEKKDDASDDECHGFDFGLEVLDDGTTVNDGMRAARSAADAVDQAVGALVIGSRMWALRGTR